MKIKIISIFGAIIFFVFAAVIAIDLAFPIRYLNHIKKYCREYSVEPSLVLAVIWTESKYNPNAMSSAGACGLMQLMPSTAKWLAGEEFDEQKLFDPEFNIKFGVIYLSYLEKSFDGDYVLAAYNAGEGNVREWIYNDGEIRFPETKDYVKKVRAVQKLYSLRIK